MYSPVHTIARLTTHPLTIEGVELLPGTSVNVTLYGLHHNPAVWGEDHWERFDRFSRMGNKDVFRKLS